MLGTAAIDAEPVESDANVNVPEFDSCELAARAIIPLVDTVNDPPETTEDDPARLMVPGPFIVAVVAVLTPIPLLTVNVWPDAIVNTGVLFVPKSSDFIVALALIVGCALAPV